MARTHGKLLCSIWSDRDFRALDRTTQGMYMFLLSQDRLDYAGVLQVTMRNWASTADGLTVGEVQDTLDVLEKHRFIVVDHDTEELMVRTFVRRDELWRQPKMMLAVVAAARKIQSPRLRLALLTELDRLPLGELPNEPTKSGAPPARQVVARCVETLRESLFAPDDDPGFKRQETQDERVSETQSERVRAGFEPPPVDEPVDNCGPAGQDSAGNPSGLGMANPHAGGRAQSSFNFHLSTSNKDNPAAPGALFDAEPDNVPDTADADKPRGNTKPAKTPKHETADQLAAAFWDVHKTSMAQSFIIIRGIIRTTLANGLDRDDVARALDRLARECTPISGGTIQAALKQIKIARDQANGTNVVTLPGQRPSTTDARVAAAHALGAELQAEVDAQLEARSVS